MWKRLGLVVLAILLAASCGDDDEDEGQAPRAASTYEVKVDGKVQAFNGAFVTYFPRELRARPGDTVTFRSVFSGEPHTVTLGTLVDAGVPKALAAPPDAEDEPPELKKVPHLLPEGPGDAIQAAAQPCFRKSGDPPASDACARAEQTQPEFDGTYTYYNSGFLPDQATFSVKLANNIRPGTYTFFCTLHRADMSGKIVVEGQNASVPPPDQVTRDGQSQLNDMATKLQPVATAVRAGTLPPFVPTASPSQVVAGGGSQEVQGALIAEFGPANTSIPVGGSVTWTVLLGHTISFNPPEAARVLLNKAPDGSVHLTAARAPAGGPGQPPPPSGPPPGGAGGPPPPPAIVDGGRWDGTGFRSSGLFLSFPPALSGYKLTFTRAGTYNYFCLIHPDMKGSVRVG